MDNYHTSGYDRGDSPPVSDMEPKSRDRGNDHSSSFPLDNEMPIDLNLTGALGPALSHGLSNTVEATTSLPDGGLVAWMAGK